MTKKYTLLLSIVCLYTFAIPSKSFAYNSENSKVAANADTIYYAGASQICPGGSLQLQLQNIQLGSVISWYLNGTLIPSATQSTLQAMVAGSYSAQTVNGSTIVAYPPLTVTNATIPVAGFTHSADGGCATTPIHFTNTSTGTGLTYLWIFDDPNSGKSDTSFLANPVHTFIGNHGNGMQTYNVQLTAINSAGCSSVVFTAPITLNQTPSTALTGDGATNFNGLSYFASCTNAPTVFTFTNNSNTGNTFYRIKWGDKSPDFTSKNFTQTTHTFNPGFYTMFFSVTGTNGCTNTRTYYVFVGTAPLINITKPINVFCKNQPLQINLNGLANNSKGTIYTVTYSDGYVANYNQPIDTLMHLFKTSSYDSTATTSTGVFNNAFTVKIVAANPCGAASTDTGPLYVSDPQGSNFSITPAGVTAAVNATEILSYADSLGYTVLGDGTAFNNKLVWKISPANGLASNSGLGSDNNSNDPQQWVTGLSSPAIQFQTAGKYTITLKTGNKSCGIDSTTQSICVDNVLSASYTADKAQVCEGSVVNFTNTSPSSVCGITKYTWTVNFINDANCTTTSGYSFSGGTNLNSTNPQILFTNAGNYKVSLKLTSSEDTVTHVSSKIIAVLAQPQIKLTAADTVCYGQTMTPVLTITNCSYANIDSYQWSFPGAVPSTSTAAAPPILTYSVGGYHQIMLISTTACDIHTDSTTVYVNPEILDYTITSGDQNVKPDEIPKQIIAGTATGGTGQLAYQWESSTDNNTWDLIAGATQTDYQPDGLKANIYFRRITTSGACTVISNVIEIYVNYPISIPKAFTPNNDGINDTWDIVGFNNDPTVDLKVFNRYGAILMEQRNHLSPWDGNYNGKKLPPGTYYYIITGKDVKLSGYVVIIY